MPEAQEHLEGIETHLIFLEQHPDDLEAINAIFRPFHTLKGVAGFLNLAQIQELSHEVEWLLDRVRDGQVVVSSDLVNLVLKAVDFLKVMLDDLQGSLTEGRGLATFDLTPMKAKIKEVETTSSVSAPRLGEILVAQKDLSPEDLIETLENQKTMENAAPLGEMLVQEGKVAPQKVAEALVKQMVSAKPAGESPVADTVKVDITKVDNLVDLMGELVIVQSQARQNQKIRELADQKLGGTWGRWPASPRSYRKFPCPCAWCHRHHLSQDGAPGPGFVPQSRERGRPASGRGGHRDRPQHGGSHLRPLGAPGAQLRGSRSGNPGTASGPGQAPQRSPWLRSFHQGGDIIIEIEDDGRGLNREAILAKAIDRGLVAPGQTLSPEKTDHLIFKPGFSTTSAVTEISGRGVGLDVVKQAITHLRGKIDIAPRRERAAASFCACP